MGGKIWSAEEEKYFWEVIVPQAPSGLDSASKQAKRDAHTTWVPLSQQMEREMTRRLQPGESPRRIYTPICCYEHYFQNYINRQFSPHAKSLVVKYQASLQAAASSTTAGPLPNTGVNERTLLIPATAAGPSGSRRASQNVISRKASRRVSHSSHSNDDDDDDDNNSNSNSNDNAIVPRPMNEAPMDPSSQGWSMPHGMKMLCEAATVVQAADDAAAKEAEDINNNNNNNNKTSTIIPHTPMPEAPMDPILQGRGVPRSIKIVREAHDIVRAADRTAAKEAEEVQRNKGSAGISRRTEEKKKKLRILEPVTVTASGSSTSAARADLDTDTETRRHEMLRLRREQRRSRKIAHRRQAQAQISSPATPSVSQPAVAPAPSPAPPRPEGIADVQRRGYDNGPVMYSQQPMYLAHHTGVMQPVGSPLHNATAFQPNHAVYPNGFQPYGGPPLPPPPHHHQFGGYSLFGGVPHFGAYPHPPFGGHLPHHAVPYMGPYMAGGYYTNPRYMQNNGQGFGNGAANMQGGMGGYGRVSERRDEAGPSSGPVEEDNENGITE